MENIFENKFEPLYVSASQEDEVEVIDLLKSFGGDMSDFDINNFLIAKNCNQIIGCVRVKDLQGCTELASLAVRPDYQHHGIGSNLVTALLSKEGMRPMFLLTSSDKEVFYKKFGFNVVESEKLSDVPKDEYERVSSLPFAKNMKVIVMTLG